MLHRYRLFRISGFELRLGLGLVLLLASTGLALATALLLAPARTSLAGRRDWAVGATPAPRGFNPGSRVVRTTASQPFAALAPNGQPYSLLAGSYQGQPARLPRPVLYHAAGRGTDAGLASPPTGAGYLNVVQRSWGTIKTMFR